jgi:hypothetical protein
MSIQTNKRLPDAANCSASKNYTQIPNNLLRNPNISGKGKTILSILLSNKSGWTSYITKLKSMMKEGEDAIRNGIKELEKYGYLCRVRYRDKNTKTWVGSFWAYTDIPKHFDVSEQIRILENNNMEIPQNILDILLLTEQEEEEEEDEEEDLDNTKEKPEQVKPHRGNPDMDNPVLKRLYIKRPNKKINSKEFRAASAAPREILKKSLVKKLPDKELTDQTTTLIKEWIALGFNPHKEGTKDRQSAEKTLYNFLQHHSYQDILGSMKKYYSLLSNPYTKLKEGRPTNKVGLRQFLEGFNTYQKKGFSLSEKEWFKGNFTWFVECLEDEQKLLDKWSYKSKDRHPTLTKALTEAYIEYLSSWYSREEEAERLKSNNIEQREKNLLIKGSRLLYDLYEKYKGRWVYVCGVNACVSEPEDLVYQLFHYCLKEDMNFQIHYLTEGFVQSRFLSNLIENGLIHGEYTQEQNNYWEVDPEYVGDY